MLQLKEGNFYHIYNRGNNKEDIFREERNYHHFLFLYQKYVVPFVDTFAYCLLKNHFHLLIRIKGSSQSKTWEVSKTSQVSSVSLQFSHLFNAYAKAFNKAYNRTGSLFQERFQRKLITTDTYLLQVLGYIHLNPQHHGFIEDFRLYPYSSYQTLISKNDTFLACDEVILWFGNVKQFEEFHRNVFENELLEDLIKEDRD